MSNRGNDFNLDAEGDTGLNFEIKKKVTTSSFEVKFNGGYILLLYF